jgi:hypothetical protein
MIDNQHCSHLFQLVFTRALGSRIPAARRAEVLREVGDFCRARPVS